MAQVTIYLDDETEARMSEAARAAGLSKSRWIAQLIQNRTATEWPQAVVRLEGAWADFPTAEDIRAAAGEDVPREPL